jgi:hypothetical protein
MLYAVLVIAAPSSATATDMNCDDFATAQDAQDYYERYPGDPSRLDADGDGRACDFGVDVDEVVDDDFREHGRPDQSSGGGSDGRWVFVLLVAVPPLVVLGPFIWLMDRSRPSAR